LKTQRLMGEEGKISPSNNNRKGGAGGTMYAKIRRCNTLKTPCRVRKSHNETEGREGLGLEKLNRTSYAVEKRLKLRKITQKRTKRISGEGLKNTTGRQ